MEVKGEKSWQQHIHNVQQRRGALERLFTWVGANLNVRHTAYFMLALSLAMVWWPLTLFFAELLTGTLHISFSKLLMFISGLFGLRLWFFWKNQMIW